MCSASVCVCVSMCVCAFQDQVRCARRLLPFEIENICGRQILTQRHCMNCESEWGDIVTKIKRKRIIDNLYSNRSARENMCVCVCVCLPAVQNRSDDPPTPPHIVGLDEYVYMVKGSWICTKRVRRRRLSTYSRQHVHANAIMVIKCFALWQSGANVLSNAHGSPAHSERFARTSRA